MSQELINSHILLDEVGEPREIEFSDKEIKKIKDEFSKILTLQYKENKKWSVKASHYVGIIALEEHIIEIKPKVPASFYGMLEYALDLPKLEEEIIPITKNSEFWQVLILFLLKHLEIIEKRMYSNYIETEENLNLVRGRIDFSQNLLYNFSRVDKIYCKFTEFTMNILENQLIKTTLYRLIHGMNFFNFPEDIKRKLRLFYSKFEFAEILSNPERKFNEIKYTRLNNHYQGILKICELLLLEQSLKISPKESKSGFGLYVNTNDLFEKFIGKMLQQKCIDILYGKDKTGVHYDAAKSKKHYPDFIIKKNKKKDFILDTKYYSEKTSDDEEQIMLAGRHIGTGNIAQMVFYSNSTGIRKLGLLYPGEHEPDKIMLKNDLELHILHINLQAETKQEFEDNCELLKKEIENLI